MKGLWLGIICALLVQVFFLLIVMAHIDWNEEVYHSVLILFCYFICSDNQVSNCSILSCSGKEGKRSSIWFCNPCRNNVVNRSTPIDQLHELLFVSLGEKTWNRVSLEKKSPSLYALRSVAIFYTQDKK